MADSNLYALILAGGSGSRLWPYSRRRRPKQLLPLVGERSMLQATVDRLAGLVPAERVVVVTNAEHAAEVRAQLPELSPHQVLAEPAALGTAAAIGLGMAVLAARDAAATLAVLPADHLIAPPEAFRADLVRAAGIAATGRLVTFGIPPASAETGYGYVELAAPLDGPAGAHAVARFVEKPDAAKAEAYVAGGRHLWNSGMFVWRLDTMLGELQRLLPDLAARLEEIRALAARGETALEEGLPEIWRRITDRTTIDYGVMERTTLAACLPASFTWTDVGSWAALAESLAGSGGADPGGNVILGPDVLVEDTRGSLVLARGNRLVVTVGVDDLVVVDTGDALLVCRKERAQDVRRIVDRLAAADREELL